jgi:tight adherence protein B
VNRSRRLAGLLALWVVALLGLAPAAFGDEPLPVVAVDVAAYPDVRLVVAVPPQLGDQSLRAPTMTVIEGGTSRPVTVEVLPPEQLEVALVIDTSGSMSGAPLAAAKVAAEAFLAELPPTVPVSVIGFGATPTLVGPRSTDRSAQRAAVNRLTAGGGTAMYDALRMALTQMAGSGTRHIAVLLTDGGDTASTSSLDATAADLAAAKVPLFAVELATSESSPAALARLTQASGGRVMPAAAPGALSGAFNDVVKQLVRQYALTYRSQANGGTDIEVAAEARGVKATGRVRLELPAAPVVAPARAAATTVPVSAAPAATASSEPAVGDWALVVGAGLLGMVFLGGLLAVTMSRTPRVRSLAAPRRTLDTMRLGDRMEALGTSLLRHPGGLAAVGKALELASVDLRPGELVVGTLTVSLLVLAGGWFLLAPVVGVVLAVLVPVGVRGGLRLLAARRRRRFADQLAETLQILAGSLRAGHGLAQGIDTVAREAESPTAEEFRRLTIEARLGRDFVEALGSLADRVGSEDFLWVVQAIQIQREVGGDLAEILDTVAGTVRDRNRIRLQVSALSAEGRMSAWVLMILPFGLGAIMSMTNRSYMTPLVSSGTGLRLLTVGAVLLTVGGLWLRRIVKPTF